MAASSVLGGARAETLWTEQNRYIELAAGVHRQDYRERDTRGWTADGILNAETGEQRLLSLSLRWQGEAGAWLSWETERQSGPTDYNGYLQGAFGLTPYRAHTGNVALSHTFQLGYALNQDSWAALPARWQWVPMLHINRYRWQRDLVQYGEAYRYNTLAAGALVQWQARPGMVVETQAMWGRTQAASVEVPGLGFAASQPGGHSHEWRWGISQDLGVLSGGPELRGWRLAVHYVRSSYRHGASPVVNGLQAPPNQRSPVAFVVGIQKQF